MDIFLYFKNGVGEIFLLIDKKSKFQSYFLT